MLRDPLLNDLWAGRNPTVIHESKPRAVINQRDARKVTPTKRQGPKGNACK